MARQPGPYRPSALVSSRALGLGVWIIVGAIGLSGWPSHRGIDLSFTEVLLLTIIPMIYIIMFLILNTQYSFHPSPPVSSGGVFIMAMMCCFLTAAFCIITSGSRNLFQDYFLVIGSIFAGSGIEIFTGLLTYYLRGGDSINDIRIQGNLLERVDEPSR